MKKDIIGVIGLGYVGLPLAIAFGKVVKTIGYDKSKNRIKEIQNYYDSTLELSTNELRKSKLFNCTDKLSQLSECNIFIITVPTPIFNNKKPNLSYIKNASYSVSKLIKKNDIIIYESTVYPGTTEEVCVPIIEKTSGLKFNIDFYCGYSPERINPGDKNHKIEDIKKITSGSNVRTLNKVDRLYKKIIKAGTFKASSIKVAEAAKVIENTQRDINIALVNELSIIFNKLNLNSKDILAAAGSKWNFLNFKPGLVGGHCIGVDPYYLTYKAKSIGYKPKLILSGRHLNDKMSDHVYERVINLIKKKKLKIKNFNTLVLGITFKENCPDIRNTKVIDLISKLKKNTSKIDVYDPWVNLEDRKKLKNINFVETFKQNKYEVIILAVAHKIFRKFNSKKIKKITKKNSIIFDVKNFLDSEIVDEAL
jgi:UDP-N-acetyl-D-galactosamine dehydrogenase